MQLCRVYMFNNSAFFQLSGASPKQPVYILCTISVTKFKRSRTNSNICYGITIKLSRLIKSISLTTKSNGNQCIIMK